MNLMEFQKIQRSPVQTLTEQVYIHELQKRVLNELIMSRFPNHFSRKVNGDYYQMLKDFEV